MIGSLWQPSIIWAGIGLALGIVTGWTLARRDRTGAGFGALGTVIGLFLGLSATPVLSSTITVAFTLVGVLLPIYLPAKKPAEGDSPPPVGDWLFPFAATLAVGALAGIALRVNDGLNFNTASLKDHYHKLGFDEAQVQSILDRQAKAIAGDLPSLAQQYKALGFTDQQVKDIMDRQARTIVLDPAGLKPLAAVSASSESSGGSNLQAHKDKIDYQEYWSFAVQASKSPDENLAKFKSGAGAEVKSRIQDLERHQLPPQTILETLKRELHIP